MHSLQFNIYFRCVNIRLNSAKEIRGEGGGGGIRIVWVDVHFF